jgi:hypothetical protein
MTTVGWIGSYSSEGLQGMGLDRQPEAGLIGEHAAVPGRGQADRARVDAAPRGLDPDHPAAVLDEAGHLAVLDDVDAHRVTGPGERPGHVVVLGDARAWLERPAEDRVAHLGGDVDDRADLGHLVRLEPLGVHPVEAVGVDPPGRLADVLQGVGEVEDAALAEQEVVVQLGRQPLPLLERELVDRRALVPEVAGSDDRGVAGHVAAREPALLQHGDVGHAVVLR